MRKGYRKLFYVFKEILEMDGLITTIISIIGSTIITTVVAVVIKESFSRHFRKIEEEEASRRANNEKILVLESQKSREEIKLDIREAIREAVEPMKKDLEMIKKGTQAGLRYDLFMMADEWLAKGFCPRRIKSDFEYLYNQYHLLGKNGVMDSTYKAILALPEKSPELKKTTRTRKKSSKGVIEELELNTGA
jgi:hypothetical protein